MTKARLLFDEGAKYYNQGKLDEALEKYEGARKIY